MHGSGIKLVLIKHRSGRENANADALSRSLEVSEEQGGQDSSVVVTQVCTDGAMEVTQLLQQPPGVNSLVEPDVRALLDYLKDGALPSSEKQSRKLVHQASLFAVVSDVLYYLAPKHNYRRRAVVPKNLRKRIMESVHGGSFAGHFSGNRLYKVLVRSWYWEGMYTDCEGIARAVHSVAVQWVAERLGNSITAHTSVKTISDTGN